MHKIWKNRATPRTPAESRRPTGRQTGGAVLTVAALCTSGCLPEDTRPEPASVRVEFGLASTDSLEEGTLRVTTADDYVVSFSEVLVSLGVVEFEGDDCKPYAENDDGYVRVMDPLQPGEQPIGLHFALGQCAVRFSLRPPELWAVINPGASEEDRSSLRAAPFDVVEAEGLGTGGPLGASLRVVGSASPVGDPEAVTPFRFEFGLESESPLCAPTGEEWFSLGGGDEVELRIEMAPEALLSTCEASPRLLFGPFAAAAAALPDPGEGSLSEGDLEGLVLGDLPEAVRSAYTDSPTDCVGPSFARSSLPAPDEPPDNAEMSLRQWLEQRARSALLGLQGSQCEG